MYPGVVFQFEARQDEHWQNHRRNGRDNGDDHQEFTEGETRSRCEASVHWLVPFRVVGLVEGVPPPQALHPEREAENSPASALVACPVACGEPNRSALGG